MSEDKEEEMDTGGPILTPSIDLPGTSTQLPGMDATAEEVAKWFNTSDFQPLARYFKGVRGSHLYNLSKEDLVSTVTEEYKILAISFYNKLHPAAPSTFADAIHILHLQVHPSPPLFELPHFISRGGTVENTISHFIKFNKENLGKLDKHDFAFLYGIGGSGYGKTWTGKYVPHRVRALFQGQQSIYTLLDFSNGDRFDELIDKHGASVALGFRIAAKVLFRKSASSLLGDIVLVNRLDLIPLFQFEKVMDFISQAYKAKEKGLLFTIHLDELQYSPQFAQTLLHTLGDYMCSPLAYVPAFSTVHNIVIYPVITGTSNKHFKTRVTGFSDFQVQLEPFNLGQSKMLLEQRIPGIEEVWLKDKAFIRLILSCGGIPRILDFLIRGLLALKLDLKSKPNSSFLNNVRDKLLLEIDGLYKIMSGWAPKFGGLPNLRKVIGMAYVRKLVLREELVDGERTLEDIMLEGVLFLKPHSTQNADGNLKTFCTILFPHLIMHLLNISYNLYNINLLDPLSGVWDWDRFEKFDTQFEVVKTTLLLDSGMTVASFGDLYTKRSQLKDNQFNLTQLKYATEVQQFLKKNDLPAPVRIPIDTMEFGSIDKKSLVNYAFRCTAGNAAVDTRIFRTGSPDNSEWMFCKQSKHTIANSKVSKTYLEARIEDFDNRIKGWRSVYRCPLIIITNRAISETDFEDIHKNFPGVALICPTNMLEYLSPALSIFMLFDEGETPADAMEE